MICLVLLDHFQDFNGAIFPGVLLQRLFKAIIRDPFSFPFKGKQLLYLCGNSL